MEGMIFVEILDRRGRVRQREPIERLPFRIGRGYDCDLIVDDAFVDALHAIVDRDDTGRVRLRDADSRNGLRGNDSTPIESPVVPLGDDFTVRIGRTTLRFRTRSFAVGEALEDVQRSLFHRWLLEHWSAPLVLATVFLGILTFDTWRQTTVEFDAVETLTSSFWGIVLIAAWAGAWALFNRLLRQRTRFVAHATIALGMSAFSTIYEWGFEWLRFVCESVSTLQIASEIASTATVALLLFGHLTVMRVAKPALRVGIVAAGFAAVLALQLAPQLNDEQDWTSTLPYWSRLEPVDPTWLDTLPADRFFESVGSLETELQELVDESKEQDAADA